RARLDLPAQNQAGEFRCPDCNLLIELPAASAAPPETAVPPAKTKTTKSPPVQPKPQPAPQPEPAEKSRPTLPPPVPAKTSHQKPKPQAKETAKRGGSSWLMIGGLLAVVGGLLVCCVGLGLTIVIA